MPVSGTAVPSRRAAAPPFAPVTPVVGQVVVPVVVPVPVAVLVTALAPVRVMFLVALLTPVLVTAGAPIPGHRPRLFAGLQGGEALAQAAVLLDHGGVARGRTGRQRGVVLPPVD